ncbi:MAG TPA: MlaD family protein [Alphaproteobacteria bacterium]|jgi:phospholipid/cholesterol/gamma-HCH transport system substrate-binding protein
MTAQTPLFRYVRTRSGWLLIGCLVLFGAAVLQAGFLQGLFKSVLTLHILLPEEGLAGLSAGANVEVLGTSAGVVKRIVIDPRQAFHAEVEINSSMKEFVRRDSQVVIKKQFGIAGAAYLEISRGRGDPLDWDYAVLNAATDRSATDGISDILSDLQKRVYPILDDAQRTITSLANVMQGLEQGQGSVGRLMRDDGLSKQLEAVAQSVQQQVDRLQPISDNLRKTTAETAQAGSTVNERLPQLLDNLGKTVDNVNAMLASLDAMSKDLGKRVPAAADSVPALMVQTQQTLAEAERLMAQMRSSWLLGGSAAPPPETRLPATEIRP